MRKRAVHALSTHTSRSIDNLKKDEDEMLRGNDPCSSPEDFKPCITLELTAGKLSLELQLCITAWRCHLL